MKIILASQGLTTPEIAEKTAKLAEKPLKKLNVAIINEAYVGIDLGEDQKWLINELLLISKYTNGVISFVNLRAYDSEEVKNRIDFADVIYIVGGKQVILPKLFRETGFDKILKDAANSKVIFGTSAGANVLGKHIENPNYWQDQYGSSEYFLSEPALGLVDFNIIPHLESHDRPRRKWEILTLLLKENPFPLYGVNDEQAVFYNKGEISFAGGKPVKFGKQ